METKWLCIFGIVTFGGMFIGTGFSEYHNNQCRIAAIQANIDAKAIKELCK
jgi:hypothetical protein